MFFSKKCLLDTISRSNSLRNTPKRLNRKWKKEEIIFFCNVHCVSRKRDLNNFSDMLSNNWKKQNEENEKVKARAVRWGKNRNGETFERSKVINKFTFLTTPPRETLWISIFSSAVLSFLFSNNFILNILCRSRFRAIYSHKICRLCYAVVRWKREQKCEKWKISEISH